MTRVFLLHSIAFELRTPYGPRRRPPRRVPPWSAPQLGRGETALACAGPAATAFNHAVRAVGGVRGIAETSDVGYSFYQGHPSTPSTGLPNSSFGRAVYCSPHPSLLEPPTPNPRLCRAS